MRDFGYLAGLEEELMPRFIPGLKLSSLFYSEAVKPILDNNFPQSRYSAALIGWGSEVLGFDTSLSSDHHWGPRVLLFLREDDYPELSNKISAKLTEKLPYKFKGYSTNFSEPEPNGVRHPVTITSGPVNHMVNIYTVRGFVSARLGVDIEHDISIKSWLTFPQQRLLELTAGQVFHDGLGELEEIRRKFHYYPRDIWLYQLVAQWIKIFEDREFVSRSGDAGDELGSMVIASRQVYRLMRLCFLMERKYAPYTKWFGTAFSKLNCASELGPIFKDVLLSPTWKEREENLARAFRVIAPMHNALKITRPIEEDVSNYHGRPYRIFDSSDLIPDILNRFTDDEVRSIKHGLGSLNQIIDTTDQLSRGPLVEILKAIYK